MLGCCERHCQFLRVYMVGVAFPHPPRLEKGIALASRKVFGRKFRYFSLSQFSPTLFSYYVKGTVLAAVGGGKSGINPMLTLLTQTPKRSAFLPLPIPACFLLQCQSL